MTGEQRRHLAVSIRYIGQLLDEADRILQASRQISEFASFTDGLTDSQKQRIRAALDHVRRDLLQFGERFHLEVRGQSIDVTHAVRVQLSVASISITEMRPRSMRGYGSLDPQSAIDLDAACDELESSLMRAQQIVEGAVP